MTKRFQGTVKWWSNSKGYGFVQPDKGQSTLADKRDVFIHYTGCRNAYPEALTILSEGERVEFDLIDGPKGPQALDLVQLDSVVIS